VVNNFPQFLAFTSHVPVLVDGDFRVIELAILDYLEARYPELSLLPSDASFGKGSDGATGYAQ